MNSSRIWIDLSSFFSDVRQQGCILVDHENLKTIKDVENYISRVFEIDSSVFILNDGWLLPSSESSLLFRDNDTVSVIPQTKSKSIKSTVVSNNEPDNPTPSILTPNRKEKGQSCSEISVVSVKNPFAQPSATVAFQLEENLQRTKKLEVLNGHASATASEENCQDVDHCSDQKSETEIKKRKRIRRKKRKSCQDVDEQSKPMEAKQSRYVMNKFFQGVSHILNTSLAIEKNNQKHIFFQEDEESNGHELKAEVTAAEVPKEEVPATACGTTPVIETNLSKLMSLGNQKSPAVFERKKSDINNIYKKTTTTSLVSMKLTPLKEIPVKETIIQFKILKMINYSPTVSEVITARVISPDFSSQQIYVQITDGLNEMESEKGKFSLDEDEEPGRPPNPYKFLNWQDLMEPMAVEY